MKQPDDVDPNIQRIKRKLDHDTDQLSDDVLARLQQARRQAVALASKTQQQKAARSRYETRTLWALAASTVLAVPLLWWMKASHTELSGDDLAVVVESNAQTTEQASEPLDASEIMLQWAQMSEEDLAIVDDLEFIAWLNEQQAEQLDQQRS